MDAHSSIPLGVILLSALVASVTDVRKFKIPNLLTLPLLFAGLLFHAINGGWLQLQSSLIGALFGFGLILFMYLMGAMGAGDVKFMAAVGAWLGMPGTAYVFAIAAFAAAVYALTVLGYQGGWQRILVSVQIVFVQLSAVGRYFGNGERVEEIAQQPDRRKRLVPFGAMVAFAATVVVLWRWLSE